MKVLTEVPFDLHTSVSFVLPVKKKGYLCLYSSVSNNFNRYVFGLYEPF